MTLPAMPAQGAPWLAYATALDGIVRGGTSTLAVAATVTASGALVTAKHNPVNASSGVKAMTLPTGATSGTLLSVEKTDASTNAVTVTGNVRGVAATTISLVWQNEALLLAADSAGSWWPVAGHKTKTALDAAYVSTKHGDPFANLVRWAPPAQVSPTVYTLTGNFQAITAGPTEDVIINGKTSAAATGSLQVTGGRNIRIIGGKWAKTTTGASIRVTDATGSVFIEGVEIDASGYNGDAINACGVQSGTLTYPDIYLQNCRVYGVNGTSGTNHADIYQAQGPIGRLFVDRFTGSSNYQGFLTAPQFAVTRQYYSRVNLTKVANAGQPITYLFWANDDTHDPVPVVIDEVYVDLPAGQTLANAGVAPYAGQTSTATSISGQAVGVLIDSEGSAYWPNVTKIGGKVYPGVPVRGDYVPTGAVGLGYAPKGYLTAAPPTTPTVASVNGNSPDVTGNVTITVSSPSDATTTTKGIVQLAGDLAGTAASPTVTKIGGATPATVATTGAYADLSGKPTIPGATEAALTGHCFTANPADKAIGAAAWPSANRQIFMRLHGGKASPTQFRINVGTSSGNIGLAVYANSGSGSASVPSGAPKFTTGSIACPAAGAQVITIASPAAVNDGDWVGLWCDNVTATFFKFSGTTDATMTAGLIVAQSSVTGGPTASPSGTFGATQCYYVAIE